MENELSGTDMGIDVREHLVRIDHQLAETSKFWDEANKLRREAFKLEAERGKLEAESRKLQRDWTLAPWVIGASLLSGVLSSAIVLLARHFWG